MATYISGIIFLESASSPITHIFYLGIWSHLREPPVPFRIKLEISLFCFVFGETEVFKEEVFQTWRMCVYSRCSGTACHLSMCGRREAVFQEVLSLKYKWIDSTQSLEWSEMIKTEGNIFRFYLLAEIKLDIYSMDLVCAFHPIILLSF